MSVQEMKVSAGRYVEMVRPPAVRAVDTAKRMRHAIGVPGGLALAVVLFTQLLGQVLDSVLDSTHDVLLAAAAVGGVVLLLAGRWVRQLPTLAKANDFGRPGTDRLPMRRGLVLLTGLDTATAKGPAAALLAQLPSLEYLAVVGSVETGEQGIGEKVCGPMLRAAGHDLPASHMRRWEFGNAESVSDAEQAVTEAIRWMLGHGLDRTEIVLDVSSGRRPMSYGAKDAADEFAVEAQYLAAAWDSVANKPLPGSQMFKVIRAYD